MENAWSRFGSFVKEKNFGNVLNVKKQMFFVQCDKYVEMRFLWA